MAITIGNLIALDGQFTDWSAADSIMTPANWVAGYQVYGALINDASLGNNYVVGLDATLTTDPVIAANTFIYLNTDQNAATGFTPFGSVGAEYYVQFSTDSNGQLQPYLYSVTSAGVATQLNGGAPINHGISADGMSIELAVPQILLTPTGADAPDSINLMALINNGAVALPGDFTANPQYIITDPSTLVAVDRAIKKVGIVYSETTAALYFGGGPAGQTAYADLFMAAQHQARAAGVSYDILTEADLTDVAKLAQYSALIFPSMENVQSSQVSAIVSALSQVVYDYHVPIITAGNFLTNDQSGAPLPGNSYANMQTLLNATLAGAGTATYSVTPDATAIANQSPVLVGYTVGELIGGASGEFAGTTPGFYTNVGYLTFSGVTQPATALANINIQGGGTIAGVIQTTTGATNTLFATTGLLGDSNLLQHAIQNAVFGTAPSLALDLSRMTGVVASRTDLDQSQFPAEVSPGPGQQGIYDALIPILQQWKQQYNFVGSYFINIGDNANPENENFTNWSISAPYYLAMLALGNEIGNHSYTHLINPPTIDANGNPVPLNSFGGSSWAENTNTLYVTPPANGSAPNWTFDYEFGQSKTIAEQNLGITIAGAAVPGGNDSAGTSQQILQYYPSVAGNLTGYVTGGWTGVGSGYPNAFGYISPTSTGSVYIAPNVTFDFTEIEFQQKTPAQALADWQALFQQLSSHSETPVIVWPWHDYGPTNWDTDGTGSGAGYTTQMFTDFIAHAYNSGYEFVTVEQLAARIAAQQKATISETTSGNVITAIVTPDPVASDLGAMALNVINGAAGQVIQSAGTWYAYDSDSIFLPYGGGTFTVTLGTTQDDVTHIDALPMRANLLSVTGDGSNLAFSITGDGIVGVRVKTPGANVVSIQGAPAATLNGTALSLTFNDGPLAISSTSPMGVPVQHDVTISEAASAVTSVGVDIIFGGLANDAFSGGGGNDLFDGGGGTDTAIYSGNRADYNVITLANGDLQISDLRVGSPDGEDTLHDVEKLSFADDIPVPTVTPQEADTDFNGDFTSDMLWRHDNGAVGEWLLSNGQVASTAVIGSAPAIWHIEGDGDFNSDGKTDILWRHDSGLVGTWHMNGTQVLSTQVLSNPAPNNWHIQGVGDFNGDGRGDILWRHDSGLVGTWHLNGSQVLSTQVYSNAPLNWHIQGTGDFNGDGRDDILWRHNDGTVGTWHMNGSQVLSTQVLSNQAPSNWHIEGAGDFNGDGKDDILWRNDNGTVGIWLMNGPEVMSTHAVASAPNAWHIESIGDYNGDGKDDILWRNDNGTAENWAMNGSQVAATHNHGMVPNSWHLVGNQYEYI